MEKSVIIQEFICNWSFSQNWDLSGFFSDFPSMFGLVSSPYILGTIRTGSEESFVPYLLLRITLINNSNWFALIMKKYITLQFQFNICFT